MIIEILAIVGFLLSIYTLYVEYMCSDGKAACDINDKFSCTKTITSKYGRTFGVPNSVGGIVFYVLVFILALMGFITYVKYLSVIAVLGSVYLAYISQFKLKTWCPVCILIYIVNILLLVFSW